VWPRVQRELKIFAAVFAGLFVYTALEIFYLTTYGGFFLLTGLPTPGGAPLAVHLMNTGIKGGWAALAYVAVMRLYFGPIIFLRVVALWALGLGVIGVLASMAMHGTIAGPTVGNLATFAYLLVGQMIARDWIAQKPSPPAGVPL
jgi:hypothetical protein